MNGLHIGKQHVGDMAGNLMEAKLQIYSVMIGAKGHLAVEKQH